MEVLAENATGLWPWEPKPKILVFELTILFRHQEVRGLKGNDCPRSGGAEGVSGAKGNSHFG